MTHRNGSTSDVLVRWRVLAERRLAHLTELFESGRWRRYYSERGFLENIKEAKDAVETWRGLAALKPVAPRPVLRRPAPAPVAQLRKIEQAAAPIELPVAAETEIIPVEAPAAPVIDLLALERALEVPELDLAAIEDRYPLLRNVF